MGISRPLVSVLLTEARSCGIVTITINQVESPHQLTAGRLEKRFGLHRALVLPDENSPDSTDNALAAAAYELCFTGERRAANVGMGWGSMMGRMADHAETLPDAAEHRGRIFPLIGGIGASYRSYHNNEIARIISGKTGHSGSRLCCGQKYTPRIGNLLDSYPRCFYVILQRALRPQRFFHTVPCRHRCQFCLRVIARKIPF